MKMITILIPWKINGGGLRAGRGRCCWSVAFMRRVGAGGQGAGAMNIVDKLTPNSKTVVNTEEEKKNILNVAHLVTKSCKKKEKKSL